MIETYIIYKITNKVNGKIYIGYTSLTVERRWEEHCNSAKYNTTNQVLHRAIRKYGAENFFLSELTRCTTKTLALDVERQMIKEYKTNMLVYPSGNGYNMTDGGDGGNGYKHTEETIELLRENGKRYRHSEESKQKISMANRGKKLSNETKSKIGDAHRGKKLSEHHRQILSQRISERNNNLTKEQRQKLKDNAATARSVEQYTIDGVLVATYEQIEHAASATGIGRSNISSVCRGRTKTAGGFVWKYQHD